MTSRALEGRRVLVCVSGGIAAFKSAELVRELGRRGAMVRVALTPSGARFVGPLTFAGITGRPVAVDLWDPRYPGEVHVELAAWAELVVVAPATANLMARAAAGMADDVVLATLSCTSSAVLYAPAMHHRMWASPKTERAVATLVADGACMVGPVHGALASGEEGLGRMAEPGAIADACEAALADARETGDLAGRTILVTAGPTHEDIDPVRFIANRSSGKMGYAIAERAASRGARVVLVTGPVALVAPASVETVRVRSAIEMRDAVMAREGEVDAIVMAAAVADYRPKTAASEKIKKGGGGGAMQIDLVKNPDILSELGARRAGKCPVLVGFAMETNDVAKNARAKLVEKKVDLVVANHAAVGFGGESNEVTFVSPDGDEHVAATKLAIADVLLDRVRVLVELAG